MKWDRIGAMNAARARLPASGGKTYKQTAPRRQSPAMGTWERLTGLTTARWESASGITQEDYLRAAFPERYEGF
jgi:hypothetical protein